MLIFLILLMLGFFYEVVSGALNWYNTPSYYLTSRFTLFNYAAKVKLSCVSSLFKICTVNFLYSRKGIYLLYLNLNICLSLHVFKLLIDWDQFLFNSKFQFSTAGLSHSLIQISITQELPNIWFGLDFFNLYLILLTTLLFTVSILSNWNSDLIHSSYLFLLFLI